MILICVILQEFVPYLMLFTGKYNFKKNNGNINVEEIARILEQLLKQSFWKNN